MILTVLVPEKLVFSSCWQYDCQLCLSKLKSLGLAFLTFVNKTIEPIDVPGIVFFFLCAESFFYE